MRKSEKKNVKHLRQREKRERGMNEVERSEKLR